MLTLKDQQIDALEYDDSRTIKLLDNGSKDEIKIFKAHVSHRRLDGTPIGNDYLSVTPEGFYDSCERLRHSINLSSVLEDIKRMGSKYKNELTEFYEMVSFKEVQGSKEEETPEREATGPGNNKENVLRELEQPDLKEKSTLAMEEHNKDIGQYYNKIKK